MKTRYVIAVFCAAFLLQTTFMNLFSIGGRGVNILLTLLLVFIYLFSEHVEIIAAATAAAFLYDVCFAQYTGISALSMLMAGLAAIVMKRNLKGDDVRIMLIVAAAGTLIYNLIFWGIMAIGGHACDFTFMLVRQPGYVIFNMAASCVLFFAFRKLSRRKRRGRYYL